MAELRYVDWDGLVYYDGKIKDFIQANAENYLKMGGILPVKDLPDPSRQNLNYIYKITDSFTSDDHFEKPGYVYPAGTWVQCINHEEDERWLYTIFNEETIGGTADLSNYYTKSEVNKKIEEAIASIETPEVDLNNYYTKEEVNTLIPDISELVTREELEAVEAKVDAIVIPEVPTKVSELDNDAGYVTAKDIPETDLSNYYNKSETENLIAEAVKDIEHPTVDLEGYATEDWVNEQGFLKEHQDLSEYAKKSDIPQPELFVVDYNAPDFAAALEAYNNGKLLLLTNAAPDANGYAVMNYVREDLITFTKFLMSRSETYGSFNTYYLHNDNIWELAKEVKLNKVDAIVDENSDITGLTIGKNTYEFDNFATTETVNQINKNIQNIENTYVTNETLEQKNYVTEQYVVDNYITQEAAKETYVTTEKVTEVVETQVNEVVTKEIETKVETVIQEKVDAGEIEVNADAINYDTWD